MGTAFGRITLLGRSGDWWTESKKAEGRCVGDLPFLWWMHVSAFVIYLCTYICIHICMYVMYLYIYISQIKFLIWYYVCMEYYWWNMIIKWPLSSCYTDEYDYRHLDYWHNEWNVILNIYIYILYIYICHICNIIFNVTYVYIHAHTIDILFSQSWGSWNRPISTRLRLQIMSRQGDQQLAPPVQCAWGTCPWLQASNETGTWYLVIVFLVFFLCLKTEHQVPLKCWKHWHWSQKTHG